MHIALVHFAPVLAAEKSKTPFFIAGGVLVAWALLVSVGVGLRVSGFPRTVAAERALMAVTAVLVVVAAAMAVATSGGSTKAQAAAATTGPSAQLPSNGTSSGAAQGGTTVPQAGVLSQEADPSGKLRFTKPRLTAKAGRVSIAFTNHSPLAHNLTIASSSKVLGATATFEGGAKTLTVKLAPGAYKFFCSVPGHREAGMEGTLVVS